MDFTSTPGPSSLSPYSLRPNYNGQDDSPSPSQGENYLGNIQSSGLQEIRTLGEPSSHAYHPPEIEYPSILHPIPSMPNRQSRLYDPSLHSSQGLPLTMPASPFPTDSSGPGTRHFASTQYGYPASQDIYKVSVLSARPVLSSSMIAGSSSSLSAESYTPPAWRDDYGDLTSFPCGQVESTTENLAAMPGQIATTQEASLAHGRKIQRNKGKDMAGTRVDWFDDTQEAALTRERKIRRKKDLDKARKKTERSQDKQAYTRICQLLNIDLDPINTLATRILDGVESMAEQLKLDNDTRGRLKEAEAHIRFLNAKLDKFQTGADTGSFLPNNYHNTLADSDTTATLRRCSRSKGD